MTNAELLEKLKKHQENPHAHPLTCGKDPCREDLVPQEHDGNVVLVCRAPGCGYVQTRIPSFFTGL